MLELLLVPVAEVRQICGTTSNMEGYMTVVKNYEASTGAGILKAPGKKADSQNGLTGVPVKNDLQWSNDQDESVNSLLKEITETLEYQTHILFRNLFTVRGRDRDSIRETIIHKSTPTLVAMAAIREFRQKGNEDRLSLASSILADAPVDELLFSLRQLAKEDCPESYAFIGLLNTNDISDDERNSVLTQFIHSKHIDVADAAKSLLEDAG